MAKGKSQTRSQRRTSQSRGSKARSRSTSKGRSGSQGITTIDHDEIREWVEARGGRPASVEGTARKREAAGLLRIDFPGYRGQDTLSPIDWDEFFEKFEDAKLAFLCDDKKQSKFNKFIQRGKRRF